MIKELKELIAIPQETPHRAMKIDKGIQAIIDKYGDCTAIIAEAVITVSNGSTSIMSHDEVLEAIMSQACNKFGIVGRPDVKLVEKDKEKKDA